jgi:hypothetical protein
MRVRVTVGKFTRRRDASPKGMRPPTLMVLQWVLDEG